MILTHRGVRIAVSLWDMLNRYAHAFCELQKHLLECETHARLDSKNEGDILAGWAAWDIWNHVEAARVHCEALNLEASLRTIGRLKGILAEIVEPPPGLLPGLPALGSASGVRNRLKELREDILDELEKRFFLFVPPDMMKFYDQTEPLFGPEPVNRFPVATHDMQEAGKCYALGRYAGCVFHLMRVTEAAVLELGKLVDPNDHKPQFGSVLDKIRRLLQETKFPSWPESAKPHQALFQETLPRLYAVKHAWRDKVSHVDTKIIPTESQYTPEVTLDIWNQTVSLVRLLANNLPSVPPV